MSAFSVEIGDVILGEDASDPSLSGTHWYTGVNPNPVKVSWSRTNRVKVEDIAYPMDKTIRTSHISLYMCQMDFKTIKEDTFKRILQYCEEDPLVFVVTYPKQMWMYITDYKFDELSEHDSDYVEWSITFQQAHD